MTENTAPEGPAEETVSDEEVDEVLQEIERKRSLRGPAAVAVAAIGIAFSVFQMWLAARGFVLSVSVPGLGELTLAALQLLQINAVHVPSGWYWRFCSTRRVPATDR